MQITALQTARAGSKSIPKKNLLEINGDPLFAHSIKAAINCSLINSVWCSTDDEVIKSLSKTYNFNVIDRPKNLCGDNDSHLDAMRHGVTIIEDNIGKQDVIVLLLGNVSGIDSKCLTEAITMLEDYDSIVSVSKQNMYNPFRAMKIIDDELDTYIPQQQIKNSSIPINEKNSAGDIYYCNGNFWITKRDVLFQDDNKLPYQWLGKRIRPYIQDVFLELDAPWQRDYVEKSSKHFKGKL